MVELQLADGRVVRGLGTTAEDYAQVCRGARIRTGLAVRGEEVRSDGERAVDAWLRRTSRSSVI